MIVGGERLVLAPVHMLVSFPDESLIRGATQLCAKKAESDKFVSASDKKRLFKQAGGMENRHSSPPCRFPPPHLHPQPLFLSFFFFFC